MTTVFAAEYNHCVYESSFQVLSLHKTRDGAVAAVLLHKSGMFEVFKEIDDEFEGFPDWEQWQVREIEVYE